MRNSKLIGKIRRQIQMIDRKTTNKCMDEIIEVISKYTQDVTEAKSIINGVSIDKYSKLVTQKTY